MCPNHVSRHTSLVVCVVLSKILCYHFICLACITFLPSIHQNVFRQRPVFKFLMSTCSTCFALLRYLTIHLMWNFFDVSLFWFSRVPLWWQCVESVIFSESLRGMLVTWTIWRSCRWTSLTDIPRVIVWSAPISWFLIVSSRTVPLIILEVILCIVYLTIYVTIARVPSVTFFLWIDGSYICVHDSCTFLIHAKKWAITQKDLKGQGDIVELEII